MSLEIGDFWGGGRDGAKMRGKVSVRSIISEKKKVNAPRKSWQGRRPFEEKVEELLNVLHWLSKKGRITLEPLEPGLNAGSARS